MNTKLIADIGFVIYQFVHKFLDQLSISEAQITRTLMNVIYSETLVTILYRKTHSTILKQSPGMCIDLFISAATVARYEEIFKLKYYQMFWNPHCAFVVRQEVNDIVNNHGLYVSYVGSTTKFVAFRLSGTGKVLQTHYAPHNHFGKISKDKVMMKESISTLKYKIQMQADISMRIFTFTPLSKTASNSLSEIYLTYASTVINYFMQYSLNTFSHKNMSSFTPWEVSHMISTDIFLPFRKSTEQTSITLESIDLEKNINTIVFGKVLTLELKNSSDLSSAKLVGFLKVCRLSSVPSLWGRKLKNVSHSKFCEYITVLYHIFRAEKSPTVSLI